jgi:hypothetical protein
MRAKRTRAARAALCALALCAVPAARAEIVSYAERPAGNVGAHQRVLISAREKPGAPGAAYDLELALWRPVKPSPGAALLVEMEPEPASGKADAREIAMRRGMTILFVAPALDKLPEPVRVAALRDLIAHLRKSAGVKRVLGRGAGRRADDLAKAAAAGAGFDGLLLHDGAGAPLNAHGPKLIETYGSDAFWRAVPKLAETYETANLRRFFLAGTASAEAPANNCAAPVNARSAEPAHRALLAALDDWTAKGAAPPASREPRLSGHALTQARELRWPAIPGLADAPKDAPKDDRLVPAIDADGNETAGLRLPDQALPLATFTGWNARKDKRGAPCALGAALPFPVSKSQREKSRDPRQSLPERYGSRAYYVATVRVVADRLVKERLLLKEDADAYVAAAKTAPF